MSAELMSSSLVPYKPEVQAMQPQAPQQSSLSVNTLAVLAKTVYIKADGASTPGEQIEKVAEKSTEKETGTGTETKMPTWTKRFAAALTGKSLSKEERKLIEKEKANKQAQKDKEWKASTKKWRKNLLGNTKKLIFDNPISNFIKNHWGKLLIGLSILFLKPDQMKALWGHLKKAAKWLWANGPDILKKVWEGIEVVAEVIKSIAEWLFGKSETEDEFKQRKDMAQAGVDVAQKEHEELVEGGRGKGFGNWMESEEEFEARKAKSEAKLEEMQAGVDNMKRDTTLRGGVDDSLMKKAAVGIGVLALGLAKFAPDGTYGKIFGLAGKGLSKLGKGVWNKLIRNDVMEDKAKGYLTDGMKTLYRGKKPSLMDKAKLVKDNFKNNDYVKYIGKKAGRAGGAVKDVASNVAGKVGGVAKKVASTGGDWFKTLMGKFGSAGRFLAKMGKSVIQGLMTMGPYGWAILAGIAIGGLVWYFWDDISKAWDSIASTISEGFTKIKTSIVGAFTNVQGMVGGWLRSIGAGMIADWIDPDGADPEKEKKEFTWGGFAEELWNIYSGIWGKIFDLIKAINPIEIAKKVGGKIWDTVKGIFGMDDEEVETISDEQVKIQDDKIENRKSKGKYGTKAEFLQSEEYKSQIRKPDGTLKGINTTKQDKMWKAHLDGVDNEPSAVSTASKVIATPTTPRGTESEKKKAKKLERKIHKQVKKYTRLGRVLPRAKDRILTMLGDADNPPLVMSMMKSYDLKKLGFLKSAAENKKKEAAARAARTPEQKAADLKYMEDHSGSSADDSFVGDALEPASDPNARGANINNLHKQNAELKSGGGGVAAVSNDNSVTNHYHSGKSNPSVIMKPEAGANRKYAKGY